MDLKLLNFINVDLQWNSVKKGRRSMTRRPRMPGADGFDMGNKRQDTSAFETKKIVDAPSKKRKLLHQSPSPPPQTPCLHSDRGLPAGPQTPSVHYEDPSQRYHSNSVSQSQKGKSKTRLKNSNISKPSKKDDFSGIELLAAAACSSLIQDNADDGNDQKVLKEHTAIAVNSCSVDIKEAIVSTESDGSSNKDTLVLDSQNLYDDGNQKIAPSKGFRLHWDLNTVMDDWEEPCDDMQVQPHPQETCSEGIKLNSEGYESRRSTEGVFVNADVSVLPPIGSCNGDSFGKPCELVEDLGTKIIISKTSDCESSVSKSDVVDSLIHGEKCEDFFTSTTSVLQEQTVVKGESMSKSDQQPLSEEAILCKSYCENKVGSEDPPSECCGSNVTQDEQGHMDKIQVGYDSPFEDGEFREPIGWEENDEANNTYKHDFGTIENPLSETVKVSGDHGQTMEGQSSLSVKEAIPNSTIIQEATVERPHSQHDVGESDCGSGKESSGRKNGHSESRPSTSFDVCRNAAYVPQSRSSDIGNSYSRSWSREKSMVKDKVYIQDDVDSSTGAYEHHRLKNYNRNYTPMGGYRTQNRRQSPSERNNGHDDIHRAPNRYRYHSQEYHNPKPCYLERKARCYSPKRRSRSRSRSGSPIAWNFQKRKNMDVKQCLEHLSPERSSKCSDDRKFTDGQFRDKRQLMIRRNQRFESIGYPERLKSDDLIQFSQQAGRFSTHKYNDNGCTRK